MVRRQINSRIKRGFLGLCFFVAIGKSHATSVKNYTLDSLLHKAPLVVYGRVVQVEVDSTTGFRTVIFESQEVAKGPQEFREERDFYVPLLNRAVPHSDLVEMVPGAPELHIGEDLVLFLKPIARKNEGVFARHDGHRLFALLGFHQGKLRVLKDKQGVRRVANHFELPDVTMSPQELRKQHTTARLNRQALLHLPLDDRLKAKAGELLTLDSVLNAAREVGP